MEFQIDVPDEIKPKIMQKITQNGTLKSIKRKVKIGMMIAVEEIKNESESESYLERKIFKNASPYELKALQSIFNFLSTNKMNYTLSTLLEESAVRRNNTDTLSVIDVIDDQINHPEFPVNDYFQDEDTRYYEEFPKNQSKNEHKSNSNVFKNNYSIEINEKFDIYGNSQKNNIISPNNNFKLPNEVNKLDSELVSKSKSNSNHFFNVSSNENHFSNENSINSNYEPNFNYQNSNIIQSVSEESNLSSNRDLQGFKISRRTFERNQFVISVVNL